MAEHNTQQPHRFNKYYEKPKKFLAAMRKKIKKFHGSSGRRK